MKNNNFSDVVYLLKLCNKEHDELKDTVAFQHVEGDTVSCIFLLYFLIDKVYGQ